LSRPDVFGNRKDWDRWFGGTQSVERTRRRDVPEKRRCRVVYKQFQTSVIATSKHDAVAKAMGRDVKWERIGFIGDENCEVTVDEESD